MAWPQSEASIRCGGTLIPGLHWTNSEVTSLQKGSLDCLERLAHQRCGAQLLQNIKENFVLSYLLVTQFQLASCKFSDCNCTFIHPSSKREVMTSPRAGKGKPSRGLGVYAIAHRTQFTERSSPSAQKQESAQVSSFGPHMGICLRKGLFGCTACDRKFTRRYIANLHARSANGERPYSCLTCGKSFSRSDDLSRHNRVHGSPPAHFKCRFCERTFNRSDNLNRHLEKHERDDPGFRSSVDQRSQSSTITGGAGLAKYDRGVPPKDTLCGIEDAAPLDLGSREEFRVSASKSRPHNASLKDLQSTSSPGLLGSWTDVIEDRSDWTERDEINNRPLIEDDNRPFSCTICGKAFIRSGHLSRHKKCHQPLSKDLQCPLCDKQFTRADNLKRHLLKHREEATETVSSDIDDELSRNTPGEVEPSMYDPIFNTDGASWSESVDMRGWEPWPPDAPLALPSTVSLRDVLLSPMEHVDTDDQWHIRA
jgi:hypothetical protein